MRRLEIFSLALLLLSLVGRFGHADVVINEFQYDDTSTDDREFVELYNNGGVAVDISGWTVGSRDNGTTNTVVTIPAASSIPAGGYWVIGNTGVANLSQTAVASGVLENDSESLELWNGAFGTSTLMDGVVYEGFRGPLDGTAPATGHGALSAAMTTQVGGATYRGASNPGDLAGTPLRAASSVARYTDGVDTNNNGRDFGMRPMTPGTNNAPTPITQYSAPDVDALADAAVVAGHSFGFVGARVITPGTVVAGLNENAIPAPPDHTKAITVWDGSGGGNAVAADGTFAAGAQSFGINAYIDTTDMPINSGAGGATPFRGSEFSWFGLAGSIDGSSVSPLPNVSGQSGLSGAADSGVGNTGVAWYYEKVGIPVGGGAVSEMLYLIDAGDGGNHNADALNTTADEWVVLASFDLSSTPSGWYALGINIDAAGNGMATFGPNQVYFGATPYAGSFYVGYREAATLLGDSTPSFLRPPTFAMVVPEPGAVLFGGVVCGVIGLAAGWRRLAARFKTRLAE